MKQDKSEEIIAYRVGDHFLCPEHYQRSVKILSVHEIELPAKPVKECDIESFTCSQCEDLKEIKDLSKNNEKEATALSDRVKNALEEMANIEKHMKSKIDMIGEIAGKSRKAKFIKKTLHLACEGRPLSRKNVLTFRDFFDDFGEKLDLIRATITLSVLYDMEYRNLLSEQAERNFSILTPEKQKVTRMQVLGLPEKYGLQGLIQEAREAGRI